MYTSFFDSVNPSDEYDLRRRWKTGQHGWHYGGDLMEQNQDFNSGVYGNFTTDSHQRMLDAGGSGHNPLIDSNVHDISQILEMYQSDTFNPYSSYQEEVKQGSVADVLYGITRDQSDISNRDRINRSLAGQKNLGSRRMTNSLWNDLGLNEIVGEFNDYVSTPFSGGNPLISGDRSTGSFNTAYNESRGGAPAASPISNTGTGSFLDAYNTSRSASRPDVRSLFKEMESYENE